jgi:hypothetical protein
MLRMAHSSAALALVQPDEETADEEIQPASTKNPLRRRRPVKTSNAAAGAEAVVRALTELQESNQWYRSQLDARTQEVERLVRLLSEQASTAYVVGLKALAASPVTPEPTAQGTSGRARRGFLGFFRR